MEPVRRRSSKCFPKIWKEVGPEKILLVASKFWSLFRPFQSTHVRAATAEPRAFLTRQSQLRSWLGHGRPLKARRASTFDILSFVADVLFGVFGVLQMCCLVVFGVFFWYTTTLLTAVVYGAPGHQQARSTGTADGESHIDHCFERISAS